MVFEENYKYLIVFVVLISLMYIFLYINKDISKSKSIINIKNNVIGLNDEILVNTLKGPLSMNSIIFEHFLFNIKNKISWLKLHSKLIKNEELEELLKNTRKHLTELNSDDPNDIQDYCDSDNSYEEIIREKQKIQNHVDKIRKMVIETDDYEEHMISLLLSQLEIDIDVLLFLIKKSLCKTKRYDFRDLDKSIKLLTNLIKNNNDNFIYLQNEEEYSMLDDLSKIIEIEKTSNDTNQKIESYKSQPNNKVYSGGNELVNLVKKTSVPKINNFTKFYSDISNSQNIIMNENDSKILSNKNLYYSKVFKPTKQYKEIYSAFEDGNYEIGS